jgi:O-antigen/teichoic acid export membrane protein
MPAQKPAATSPPEPLLGTLRTISDPVHAILSGAGERERTQRDAIAAFLVRVASAGLLYLTQIVLARWIGSNEYGLYVLVWTWVMILGGFTHLGLNMAVIRLVPELGATGRLEELRGLLLASRVFTVAAGTLLAAAGLAGLRLFPELLTAPLVLPAYLGLVCIPMFALSDLQDGIGRGRGWMLTALAPPYVLRPVLLLIAMAAARLTGAAMDAVTAVGAAIVATWGATIVQSVLIERRLRREVKAGPRVVRLGAWLRISFPLLVIGGCELLLQNADVLVVARYMTPSDVAVYFAAAKTMALILFVHFAVGSAVANRYARLQALGDRAGLEAFVRDAAQWTFWPSLAVALAIIALGRPLLGLFGPQFVDGYPVMLVLVLGFLIRASMGPAEFLLNMLGEQAWCAGVLAVTATLNVALNFALVPAYGLVGAATATSISLTAAALMNHAVARRRLALEISIWSSLVRRAPGGGG